eukprot:scaffold81991_cov72-Phaeocystis_antarctica.AAC.6
MSTSAAATSSRPALASGAGRRSSLDACSRSWATRRSYSGSPRPSDAGEEAGEGAPRRSSAAMASILGERSEPDSVPDTSGRR